MEKLKQANTNLLHALKEIEDSYLELQEKVNSMFQMFLMFFLQIFIHVHATTNDIKMYKFSEEILLEMKHHY